MRPPELYTTHKSCWAGRPENSQARTPALPGCAIVLSSCVSCSYFQFAEAAHFRSFQFQAAQKFVLVLFEALQRKSAMQKYAIVRGANHHARCKYDADG